MTVSESVCPLICRLVNVSAAPVCRHDSCNFSLVWRSTACQKMLRPQYLRMSRGSVPAHLHDLQERHVCHLKRPHNEEILRFQNQETQQTAGRHGGNGGCPYIQTCRCSKSASSAHEHTHTHILLHVYDVEIYVNLGKCTSFQLLVTDFSAHTESISAGKQRSK